MFANGRVHLDKVIALYDPAEHRPLTTRFSVDARVAALCFRSVALWFLGYPAAALADADHALGDAREIKHAITLMFALVQTSVTLVNCGNYAKANTLIDELTVLADEIGSLYWKAAGMSSRGCAICPDRQSRRRSSNDILGAQCTASNRNNLREAEGLIFFGES